MSGHHTILFYIPVMACSGLPEFGDARRGRLSIGEYFRWRADEWCRLGFATDLGINQFEPAEFDTKLIPAFSLKKKMCCQL